jgi:hypothetical protein
MLAYLKTDGPMPGEYLELMLCRDVYHCTPMELANVPLTTIMRHLTCLRQEARIRRMDHGK